MIYPVYALRDAAAHAFLAPTLNSSDESARRDLARAVASDTTGMIGFKPSDFDLYRIGNYDAETGLLTPLSPVVLVVNAAAVVGDSHGV